MLNLKACSRQPSRNPLVLVETNGTERSRRKALPGGSVSMKFSAKNCIVLATTHHDELKTYASTTPGVVKRRWNSTT